MRNYNTNSTRIQLKVGKKNGKQKNTTTERGTETKNRERAREGEWESRATSDTLRLTTIIYVKDENLADGGNLIYSLFAEKRIDRTAKICTEEQSEMLTERRKKEMKKWETELNLYRNIAFWKNLQISHNNCPKRDNANPAIDNRWASDREFGV